MSNYSKTFNSNDPECTVRIGEAIGHALSGGEIIEISSDLGGGKTTLTRGIAAGAGSADAVASPTFTVSKMYEADTLTLYHFDFYRLQEAGLASYELIDALEDPRGVVIIEWGNAVAASLPEKRIHINIVHTGETERELAFSIPEQYQAIKKQLENI